MRYRQQQFKPLCIKIIILFVLVSFVALYYVVSKDKNSLKSYSKYPKFLSHGTTYKQRNFIVTETSTTRVEKSDEKLYKYGKRTEDIKLAVVLCGDRINQTLVTLKSAIMLSKRSLHFILIVDDLNYLNIIKKLLEWPALILQRLSFEIRPVTFPNGTEGDEWRKLFKLCACQRLFLPSLLKQIDSLIYVDSDVIFLRPIEELWQYFYKMNNSQIAGLSPEHEEFATGWYNRFARHPYYGPLGVNSGVMLMNLTKMREFQWEKYLSPIMKEYKFNIVWGDQDIINIIFHFHSEKLYIFSCEWNYRPDHCMYSSVCKTAEKNGIGIIHGNRGVFYNEKQPAFKTIYKAFNQHNFSKDDELNTKRLFYQSLQETDNTRCGKHLSAILS